MPTKIDAGSKRTRKSANKARKSKGALPKRHNAKKSAKELDPSARRFIRDLVIRGEAVEPHGGDLPAGATHTIVEENEDDLPTVRRERFSVY